MEEGASKVAHVSIYVVYGKPADCPFTKERPVGPVYFSEDTRTEYRGAIICWELYQKQKLPLVIIYLAPVLGAGDPKVNDQYVRHLLERRLTGNCFQ